MSKWPLILILLLTACGDYHECSDQSAAIDKVLYCPPDHNYSEE